MKKLTLEQERILKHKGTEMPGTGKYLHNKKQGMYTCAQCGNKLFDSKTKFDSGTGWPSFYDLASNKSVKLHTDNSLGMARTEVTCAKCGGHLGHVFEEMKTKACPTGQRFCINSLALDFEEKNGKTSKK